MLKKQYKQKENSLDKPKPFGFIAMSLPFLLLGTITACISDVGNANSPDAKWPDKEICDEVVAITLDQHTIRPDILLVLDKSGSMREPLSNGSKKWDVVRPAIESLVSSKGDRVHFGLIFFPWAACDAELSVPPALNNVSAIKREMNRLGPGGDTPTHQSLLKARDYFDSNPPNPDGRVVLLATDGLPSASCFSSIEQSVEVINTLQERNIRTYVLGFGSGDIDLNGLNQMAVAGGTHQMYNADSLVQLSIALDAILGKVATPSCDFSLQQTPKNDSDINVHANGVNLVRNDADGWSYDKASNTVTLLGSACQLVKNGGTSNIDVDLGCEGIIIN